MNSQWLRLMNELIEEGQEVAPRGQKTRELLCKSTTVDIQNPVLTLVKRRLGYKFMCAEAAWILIGDNRLSTIESYSKDIHKFSDNGVHFAGAYGPQFIDQVSYIVESLLKDEDTRQAVMTIWRPNPRDSKDIPCTVYVQFLIRNGRLYAFDYMRSSDVWLGFPYDIFNFSMMTYYILIMLNMRGKSLKPGKITLTATSQHVYERDIKTYCENIDKKPMELFQYKQLDYENIDHPQRLVDTLWNLADGKKKKDSFLTDLMEQVYV
jgi:thymidylate synthase